MTFKPALSVALLALFATACQPGENARTAAPATPVETASAPAPASDSQLASFRIGQFKELDVDKDLMIPTSAFQAIDGKEHSFAEYKGKVVVYNIWAEWCAPCVEEMPTLVALQKAFAGKDVVVVPVAYGAGGTLESMGKKLKELVGDDLPYFYDPDQDVNAEAKTGNLPSTIIYDKAGKEQARLEFPAKWDAPDAIALVQAILDGKS